VTGSVVTFIASYFPDPVSGLAARLGYIPRPEDSSARPTVEKPANGSIESVEGRS
jgi:hypothetical protein